MASSSSTCMVNSPIRFMALSSFRLHRIALALLERGVDPADRFPHATARAGRSLRPTGATEVAPARHAKAAERPSRLRATVHRWPSPSAPAGKAWPGENVDEPSSPAFTTGPSTATFFSKLSVMFRSSLDTSIKPILCPRKSGPTQQQWFGHVKLPTVAQDYRCADMILYSLGAYFLPRFPAPSCASCIRCQNTRRRSQCTPPKKGAAPRAPQFLGRPIPGYPISAFRKPPSAHHADSPFGVNVSL